MSGIHTKTAHPLLSSLWRKLSAHLITHAAPLTRRVLILFILVGLGISFFHNHSHHTLDAASHCTICTHHTTIASNTTASSFTHTLDQRDSVIPTYWQAVEPTHCRATSSRAPPVS